MAEIKLTKNELREQQKKLEQLQRFLPVMQLKKMMLQEEVQIARAEISALQQEFEAVTFRMQGLSKLMNAVDAIDLESATHIRQIKKRTENIAGVEVSYLESVEFEPFNYGLFETAAWVEGAIAIYQNAARLKAALAIAEEKKAALEKEYREVSIRVNLFEKILIPKTLSHIKKIKIFLADQDLAAVGRAKIAKAKIELKKRLAAHAC